MLVDHIFRRETGLNDLLKTFLYTLKKFLKINYQTDLEPPLKNASSRTLD